MVVRPFFPLHLSLTGLCSGHTFFVTSLWLLPVWVCAAVISLYKWERHKGCFWSGMGCKSLESERYVVSPALGVGGERRREGQASRN